MDIWVPIVSLLTLWSPAVSGQCHDIDRQACALMKQSNPNLCQDPIISQTACPEYCKLCPLTCYSCQDTADAAACSTKQQCDAGQKCMLRSLTSTVDGHLEYSQKCASADECDGMLAGSSAVIGRRRDLSYHCCDTDLCNMPAVITTSAPSTTVVTATDPATTTAKTKLSHGTKPKLITYSIRYPGCRRDILVLMEDARTDRTPYSHAEYTYMFTDMKNLLISMVHDMDIGSDANLVEIAVFDGVVHRKFEFDDAQTKTELLHEINKMHPNHNTNYVDYDALVHYLTSSAFTAPHGDRRNVQNDIIIFVDHRLHTDTSHINPSAFRHESGNVIVVDIGGNGAATPFDAIATDANHVIHANSYDTLYEIKPQLMALLCN